MPGTTAPRALVVDDAPENRMLVSALLVQPGFDVAQAEDGEAAVKAASLNPLDLIVLDLGLPDIDGVEVCRRVREFSDAHVLMLTAQDTELDKVVGFEAGADDYVTKPFGHLELLARVRAVLRRGRPGGSDGGGLLRACALALDFERREVTRHGERVNLTPTEYNLLLQLARNADRVQPHDVLLRRVWGAEYAGERDYLKAYVKRLRQKLEDDPSHPRHILTERGLGYRFATR